MADNTQLNVGTGGDLLSTDDIGSGVKVQRVKVQYGADGSATDVSATAPLPAVQTPTSAALSIVAGSGTRTSSAIDLLGYPWWYGVWTSVGATSTAINVQYSPDNSTWNSISNLNIDMFDGTNWTTRTQANLGGSTATGTIFFSPVYARYVRLQTASTTTGTYTLQLTGATNPLLNQSQVLAPTNIRGTATPGDNTLDNGTDYLKAIAYTMGYTPASSFSQWSKLRTPTTYKSVGANGSGSTAVWTPASGRKFRLMRYKLTWTGDGALGTAAQHTATFYDSGSSMGVVESVYLPTTAATATLGGFTTGWTDLSNGILSAAANNVLNINLSAAVTRGYVQVLVCGVEE